MCTELSIHLRAFSVRVCDMNHGERDEVIELDKQQLQATQMMGQSSKELICRICEKAGLLVLEIDRAERRTVPLNLEGMYRSLSIMRKREIEKSRSAVGAAERDNTGANFTGQVPKSNFNISSPETREDF